MNIAFEKTDDLNGVIKMHVVPEDYREQVNEVLRDYSRKAAIKGFRKGKVPISVVRRMYGQGVVYEQLNKLLTSELQNYISEENLAILGEPLPATSDVDLDPECNATYDFDYEVGLSPEFELVVKVSNPPKDYKVLVDQEMLDEEIENIRARYGEMTNPEVAGEGDTLFGKLSELDADGNAVEEGFQKMFAMNPSRLKNDKKKGEEKDKKEGDVLTFKMTDLFEDEDETRRFWRRNVSGEYVRDVTDEELARIMAADFSFEVRKINHIEKVDINKELFDKVFVAGDVETEEEFREKIEADLEKFFEGEAKKYFEGKMVEGMIEENEIPLPEAFLKKFILKTRKEVSENNVDEVYEEYQRNLRWELIIKKMMNDKPDLELKHEEIEAHARQVVEDQYKPLLPNATDEQIEHFALQMMSDEKSFSRLANEVLGNKIFGYIREQVNPESEDITASEFLKLK